MILKKNKDRVYIGKETKKYLRYFKLEWDKKTDEDVLKELIEDRFRKNEDNTNKHTLRRKEFARIKF